MTTPEHEEIFQEESWTFHTGQRLGSDTHMYVDYCEFLNGVHYPGYHCPHDEDEDPGWTVLNS